MCSSSDDLRQMSHWSAEDSRGRLAESLEGYNRFYYYTINIFFYCFLFFVPLKNELHKHLLFH